MRIRYWQSGIVLCIVAGLMSGCTGGRAVESYAIPTGGYARHGKQIMVQRQCGSCHTIPGISGANGVFGPPLVSFAQRTFIAGTFPNATNYLVPWIMSPKSMKPKTAMPDLGLSEQQARDVAAYLYTLH
ncbi:MAG: c-type cytochrome [Acidobacteriaceae bacterium]